jgi:aminoglycoside phosphotransferase (APT) family kinase protein
LRDELSFVERSSPELAALLERMGAEAAARSDAGSSGRVCLCHGDFTHSQVLFSGSDYGLIDFDNLCEADPALDLGQFCAYLEAAARKADEARGVRTHLGRAMRDRFLDGYARHMEASSVEHLGARVDAYEEISLLRMTIRAWRQLKPRRAATALACLEEVRGRSTTVAEAAAAVRGRPG